MPASKTRAQLIEEFADMGSRLAFSLQDGGHREGYIIDIDLEEFSFGAGGPLAPEQLETLAAGLLDFSTLSFFDADEHCWKDARWSDESQRWVFTKSIID